MFFNVNAAEKDPNLKDCLLAFEQAQKKGAALVANWVHLKPTKVLKNTSNKYVAKYKDSYGTYVFVITKQGPTYSVSVDNELICSDLPKDRLIWEFEVQVNCNSIKCL